VGGRRVPQSHKLLVIQGNVIRRNITVTDERASLSDQKINNVGNVSIASIPWQFTHLQILATALQSMSHWAPCNSVTKKWRNDKVFGVFISIFGLRNLNDTKYNIVLLTCVWVLHRNSNVLHKSITLLRTLMRGEMHLDLQVQL
jgi:hypothetical protein